MGYAPPLFDEIRASKSHVYVWEIFKKEIVLILDRIATNINWTYIK